MDTGSWRRRVFGRSLSGKLAQSDFPEIFRQCRPDVLSYFSRNGFSFDQAEDLTQEAFVRVYRGLATFRQDCSLATWLNRICESVYKNELRRVHAVKRDGKELTFEEDGRSGRLPTVGASQLEDLMAEDRRTRLAEALRQLPVNQRRCLVLWLRGKSYREISVALLLSVNTVRAYIRDARAELKDLLDESSSAGS